MGNDSAPCSRKKVILLALALALTCTQVFCAPQRGKQVMENAALLYVNSFEDGNEFSSADPVAKLIVGNRVDPQAIRILRTNLLRGTPFVRENIVRLLEKVGMQLNASAPLSIRVIHDKSIIQVLAVEGFAHDDPAADLAAKCLLDRVTPGDLATLNSVFMDSIAQGKGDYLYLAAKAKTREALPLLERLAAQDSWRSSPDRMEKLNIARAALGNTAIEDEFIASTIQADRNAPPAQPNRFYDVSGIRDGSHVAEQLEVLGLIGTHRSLLMACNYLRSPLKTFIPDGGERSIRYDALEALRYNFPDERALSVPVDIDDWRKVEAFCVSRLGAAFEGVTPDLRDRAYPTRLVPQSTGR